MYKYGRSCAMLAAAALALGAGAAPAGAARPSRTSVPGSVPRWAQPSRDRGDAASSKPVTVTVYLPLRNAAAADALAQQVSDPASASYGQFLTPDAIAQRFGASDADVAAVSSFLRGAGPERRRRAGQQPLRRGDRHARAGRGGLCHQRPPLRLPRPGARRSQQGAVGAVVARRQGPRRDRPRPVRRPHPTRRTTCPARRPRPRRACGPAPEAARRRPTPSSTRRRARRTSARRPPTSTRRSTARRSRSRRAATRRRSTRAPTAPRACSAKGIDGRGVTVAITDAYAAPTILAGRQHVRPAPRPAGLPPGPVQADPAQEALPPRLRRHGRRRPVRRAGLVRRGDPRRRGRARDGARAPTSSTWPGASCDDPDLLEGAQHDHREAPRRHHHQLVGRHRRGRRRPTSCRPTARRSCRPRSRASASSSPPVTTATTACDTERRHAGRRLPVLAPARHRRRRHEPRGRQEQRLRVRDGLGDRHEHPVGRRHRVGPALPGRLPLRRRRRRELALRRAVLPARRRAERARPRPSQRSPDIAMDGDPQTGMLVGETQTFPDGSVKYSEYRIGGTSLSSPLYAGVEALADQAAGHPHGFANPAIYRSAGSAALHDVRARAPCRRSCASTTTTASTPPTAPR